MLIVIFVNLGLVGVRSNLQSVVGGVQWRNFVNDSKNREVVIASKGNEVIKKQLTDFGIKYKDVPENQININKAYTIVGNPSNESMPIFEMSSLDKAPRCAIPDIVWRYSKVSPSIPN